MKRTWKYFLKHFPDDATTLVIGLQREELLFAGQLSWTWPMRMATGTEHMRRMLQDQNGMTVHEPLTATLSWESSSRMEETVGKKPTSRFLLRFMPAGVCVLECAFVWTFMCVRIYTNEALSCFSVVICIFVPVCQMFVSASEWMFSLVVELLIQLQDSLTISNIHSQQVSLHDLNIPWFCCCAQCACRSGAESCSQQNWLCAEKAAETRVWKWWKYNSFAAGVVPLTWSWTCWVDPMASLVSASHGLEAASSRRVLCTPVSDDELGVFLQPLGQLARPCCC